MNRIPYCERNNPDKIVLNGELDFDKTQHPREIYNRLCHIAEEVGGLVTTSGIHHGGRITVYPRFDAEYYVLNMYEVDEDPSTLQIMHIETWRRIGLLDLMKGEKT